MAKITIVDPGVDASTFTPSSDVNLPGTLTTMSAVAADVSPNRSPPIDGLRVTKVELFVTALGNSSGTPSGEFIVYDNGTQLFGATFGASGGDAAQNTNTTVANGATRSYTVKWRAVNGGTLLPADESVTLQLTTEDWDA